MREVWADNSGGDFCVCTFVASVSNPRGRTSTAGDESPETLDAGLVLIPSR
jgi:hypothetical protein